MFVPGPFTLGCWQASGWSSSKPELFIATVRKARDLGITTFDTAESYGKGVSEELLRKALESSRQQVQIATKFSYLCASKADVRKSLESSLRRLGTDYIDLYQQHWPTTKLPPEEVAAILVQFKQEGLIRWGGVCNWMEPELLSVGSTEGIDSFQNCYSLLWRSAEQATLPHCQKHSIPFLAYSPLAQGILANRFLHEEPLPRDPRNNNVLLQPPLLNVVRQICSELSQMSAREGYSLSELALAYALTQPGVSSLIVGCSTPQQLATNVLATKIKLSEQTVTAVRLATEALTKMVGQHDSLWGWHPISFPQGKKLFPAVTAPPAPPPLTVTPVRITTKFRIT